MAEPLTAAQRQVADRWTPRLAALGWTPICDYFLANYHRLKITALEAMILVHLMSFKWDRAAPFPSVRTIAKRMGLTSSSVRTHFRKLGNKGYVWREMTSGGTNRFHLNGLFDCLEALLESDQKAGTPSDHKIRVELLSIVGGVGRIVGFVDFLYGPDGITGGNATPDGLLSIDVIKALRDGLAAQRVTGEVQNLVWRLA